MSRKSKVALALAAGLTAMAAHGAQPSKPAQSAKPPVDRNILHAQVILDHLGFSPGILDGREGQSLTAALKGFQKSRGLPETGELDPTTLSALHPYRAWRPIRHLKLDANVLQGPYTTIPHDEDAQAKLPALGYSSPWEKLGEMFHTTPEVLQAMNPGIQLAPGTVMNFPNALPVSRAYPTNLRPDWIDTLKSLNVDANQPQGDHVVVDKSDGVLRVLDASDRLVAQFSATMGSDHDPLPIGTWKIQGFDYNPKFHFNPDLFWDAKASDTAATLPPGPNGPVGVIWLDLSKEHYGIHGTPEPQLIGRTQSHGCIRLANWDAARLSLMIKPGTQAIFQE